MKKFITFVLSLFLVTAMFAQAPVPNPDPTPGTITNFTVDLTSMSISGKQSVTGINSSVALTITPNFDIKQTNLVSSSFSFIGGGFNYRFPVLATALNNVSPNVNGLAFQFYVTGNVGKVNVGKGYFGETIGGGVNYFLTNSWSLGGEIDYAKFPGFANNTYFLEIGPKFHF